MIDGRSIAREQIAEIASASLGTVEVLGEEPIDGTSYVSFEISLPFQGIDRDEGGLPIKARERFRIRVNEGFPFTQPAVHVPHRRFAGFPHVQWGYSLCIYQSSSDWKPEQGMYGLIIRLVRWIKDAAIGNLDPEAAPLHPPIAYPKSSTLVVPAADAPMPTAEPWYGYAALTRLAHRIEITGWVELDQEPPPDFAPAIILHEKFSFFECPSTVRSLLAELECHGVPFASSILLLVRLALRAEFGTPLLVVLGAPMRRVAADGPLLPHLMTWEIPAEAADNLRRMNALGLDNPDLDQWGKEALEQVAIWAVSADVLWCSVREKRPQVTQRRDKGSATTCLEGKSVEVWGCGAIGSHVAESLVRAGVGRLTLRDNGYVAPGILVRQAFDDEQIGEAKVDALATRLARIRPDLELHQERGNLLDSLDHLPGFDSADLIIDCTGSPAVSLKLECSLRGASQRPPIASMGVSHDAQAAIVTLSMPDHTGGPADLIRRVKLESCNRPELASILEAFWPKDSRKEPFQPEPGCSEPTFVGSDADLASLSARMLNALAEAFPSPRSTGQGWLLESTGPLRTFNFASDTVIGDRDSRFEVRVSPSALNGMRAWARTSRRRAGPKPETGGLAFGEVNEAAEVIWVTEVEGPPPDSNASENHFTCGVAGMSEANDEKCDRSRQSVACIGSWHTHPNPDSPADPSDIDFGAVIQILASPTATRRTCLLLILAGDVEASTLGAHAYKTRVRDDELVALERTCTGTTSVPAPCHQPRDIGLALSGGGSRAIAFHLGCFRALHDLDLLERLQVISSVSGGSVLAAMYAYTDNSFEEFDASIVKLLRRGLVGSIARAWMRPHAIAKTLASIATTGPVSLARTAARILPTAARKATALLDSARPIPIRRFYSRTEAFRDAIASLFFRSDRMGEVKRPGLDVVINATELRTGSAFRFGSRQSGCSRVGIIPPKDALVADAVAASAAYPVLLPALDREYRFRDRGEDRTERVLLTDGGIFENLGVSPMEPGRNPSISTNVFNPDYIISCDAGDGLLDDDAFPAWWPTRMKRSFLVTFRKTQDATRKRLHEIDASGEISGFILAYLGQNDRALPWRPADLPPRAGVYQYSTNFFAMDDEDMERLMLRGELLTRLLISHYHPEL